MHQLHRCLRPVTVVQARHATTTSCPYPFPNHARPTPYHIFHLPIGASQKDIKARYYELVRIHHPDSPLGRDLSPTIRHSRFQAITDAYDVLRGRKEGSGGPADIYRQELERRRRARAAHNASWSARSPGKEWTASADDRWKDRIIVFIGIMALGAGIGPMLILPSYTASHQGHLSAARNLAEARREAHEFGEERRLAISKRVQEHKERLASEKPPDESACPSS